MGEGKQGVIVIDLRKPITELQTKFNELEACFKSCQSDVAMEAAVKTAQRAAFSGFCVGSLGILTSQVWGACPLELAREFAVYSAVNDGLTCVMKRLRGKEDVQSSMVVGFGSGVISSMAGSPNKSATSLVTSGLFSALFQVGNFKFQEMSSQSAVEDMCYTKTRSMLANLGLQNYVKNFKKGLLTDTTLPLLSDSVLKDVNLPPGARLLILDHIQRDPELKGGGRG